MAFTTRIYRQTLSGLTHPFFHLFIFFFTIMTAFPAIVRITIDISANGTAIFNTYLLVLCDISARIRLILAQSRRKYALPLTAGSGYTFVLGAIRLAIPAVFCITLKIAAPIVAFILRAFTNSARTRLVRFALRLTISAMVFVGLKIPAPTIAFVLRAAVGFAACTCIAIFIGIALRLAIPAMVLVGLKIPAPTLAFVLRASLLLAFFARIVRAAAEQGSCNQNGENAQNRTILFV